MFDNITIEGYQEQFVNNGSSDFVLLDVREVKEYVMGRIPGAVNLPLSELQTRYSELESEKPIIIVCQTGVRSVMAAKFLAAVGYSSLYNLLQGTEGWMVRGFPLER